jgi:hypothetical protein
MTNAVPPRRPSTSRRGSSRLADSASTHGFPEPGRRRTPDRRGIVPLRRVDVRRVRGAGDDWVVELGVRYDGGPWNFGVEILEFRDGTVARETIYVMDGWEAPEWRSEWRAELPHPAGGA